MDFERYEKARDLRIEIIDFENTLGDVRTARKAENDDSGFSVGDIVIALPPAFTSLVLDAIEKRATTELARLRAEFDAL